MSRQPTNEELAQAMREEGERYLEQRKAERWWAFTEDELNTLAVYLRWANGSIGMCLRDEIEREATRKQDARRVKRHAKQP